MRALSSTRTKERHFLSFQLVFINLNKVHSSQGAEGGMKRERNVGLFSF